MSTAQYHYPDALVTSDWLEAHLADPSLRIFDCTFYLVYEEGTGRPYHVVSGRADYDAGHIPGSGFLDLQEDFSIEESPIVSPCQGWNMLLTLLLAPASATARE